MTEQQDTLAKVWDKLESSPFVMLGLTSQPAHSEPMTARFDPARPTTLYFYTRSDNRLLQGLDDYGPEAMAQYVAKDHALFACMRGRLTHCTEPGLVERFWNKSVGAWFDGQRDPELRMLRFDVEHMEAWGTLSTLNTLKLLFMGDVDRDDAEKRHVTAKIG